MLTVDPNKRITMEQIIKHKWMLLAGEDKDFDALILENNRPSDVDPDLENLNEHILAHMESIELNREQIIKVGTLGYTMNYLCFTNNVYICFFPLCMFILQFIKRMFNK